MKNKSQMPFWYKPLRVLAAENDLTDRDMARIAGMAYSTYSDKKRGKIRWYEDEIYRICNHFKRSAYGIFWPESPQS
jgi:DNA-binding XRE family transcriptional regulator